MSGDNYVRGVLTLIALCLLVGLAGQLGLLASSEAEAEEPEQVNGRFVVTAVRSGRGPTLLRTDTATGEVSRFRLQGGTDWQVLGEEPIEESPAPAAPPAANPVPTPPPAEKPAS